MACCGVVVTSSAVRPRIRCPQACGRRIRRGRSRRSRKALIVEPMRAVRALEIFGFKDAEVINMTKTNSTRSAEKGSLAQIISTEGRHARAFLNYRIGHLMLVETIDRMVAAENATTRPNDARRADGPAAAEAALPEARPLHAGPDASTAPSRTTTAPPATCGIGGRRPTVGRGSSPVARWCLRCDFSLSGQADHFCKGVRLPGSVRSRRAPASLRTAVIESPAVRTRLASCWLETFRRFRTIRT